MYLLHVLSCRRRTVDNARDLSTETDVALLASQDTLIDVAEEVSINSRTFSSYRCLIYFSELIHVMCELLFIFN